MLNFDFMNLNMYNKGNRNEHCDEVLREKKISVTQKRYHGLVT